MVDKRSEPSLDQTLARAAKGDADAWHWLVETYAKRVYALLLRQCGDRELAEEITQATFVKLVGQMSRYQEQGRFESWLFRIAMNRLRDEIRRRKRQARPMDMSGSAGGGDGNSGGRDSDNAWGAAQGQVVDRSSGGIGASDEGESPFEQASRAEQIELLRQAVAQLNQADQEILLLRHTAGLSFAQIAQTLDEPLGTVLARGHRALAKLRKLMEERDNIEA